MVNMATLVARVPEYGRSKEFGFGHCLKPVLCAVEDRMTPNFRFLICKMKGLSYIRPRFIGYLMK